MELMSKDEQKIIAIERYTNIQRIKKYGLEEIEYQENEKPAE